MNALTSPRHVWTYRALFLGLCVLVIGFKLLPLSLDDTGVPGPDLLLALTLAWLLRQPAVVPLGSILVVFLLADFLFQRPPGLWTLLVIVVSESLRRRRLTMTEFPFLLEWSAFAGAVFTMILADRLILWVLMVDLPPLGLTLAHGIVTAAIYPAVVAVSKFLFGLRKIGPAEAEAL
ncbi:rod shape-determining protein MreD [Roseicyclus persicicus]|uniref:Rod shape-determining protein MreD n=1 Tax=Roseicyclus persicicus TaxID=2650661 RepID=A0A7X6GXU2_9RHOB|nr:rod shape-determining protein MreD [Roseibacterium persicicum]NKX43117.1 rod shape-determining protein MreD [Roseibacterium persicicum]